MRNATHSKKKKKKKKKKGVFIFVCWSGLAHKTANSFPSSLAITGILTLL
jgi:hypothetical protein